MKNSCQVWIKEDLLKQKKTTNFVYTYGQAGDAKPRQVCLIH